ncbi:MAG: hypothetical protein DMG93_01295 [Acidobacteria bacterium]|nr:MAG: hypothetical protein DMG93_01295 [Acidobacteriota bacterium]
MLSDERRSNPRTKLNRLAYIHIEPDNGGIVLNVSGDGLAFHSMNAVEPNGTLRFSLQEQNHRIDVCGKLIWTDEVQKIGGLRFTTLTSEARHQLSDWMSRPELAPEESHSTLGAAFLRAFPGLGTRDVTRDFGFTSSFTAAKAVLKARVQSKLSGFAGGMVTGLLVSLLAASVIYLAYSYRHQFGESLIHVGERLAQKSAQPQPASSQSSIAPAISEASHRAPAAATPLTATSAPVAKVPAVSTQPGSPDSAPLQARASSLVPAPSITPTGKSAPPQSNAAVLKVHQQTRAASKAAPNSPASEAAPPASTLAALRTPELPPISSPTPAGPSSGSSNAAPLRESVDIVHNPTSPADLAASLQMFFDLGKFKQQSAAEALSDQVAQLGVRSSVVPRGHLWMNSYQVLVGPYTDAAEEKKINSDLLSHGYKPRPFERGSRNFAFRSRVAVERTKLPAGDCIISWETYVTEAKVKFMQNRDVVATTAAKWMTRAKKYSNNEYVYQNQPDGSRPLVEIHFAGLDRALVFRNSQ